MILQCLLLLVVVACLAVAGYQAALFSKRKWDRICKQTVYVRPTTKKAQEFVTEMRGIDTSFFMIPDVPVVYVFEHEQISFQALQRGLERTLNQIPIAAGRVRLGKQGLEITCVDSPGCFLQFHSRMEMANPPSIDSPPSAFSKFGIVDPLIPQEPFGRPLLSATLTHFAQGCCLYINYNHSLFDGHSMVAFAQTWSQETAIAMSNDDTDVDEPTEFSVECNHSFPANVELDLSTEELAMKMSAWDAIKFLLGIAWVYYTDQVVDFDFDLEQWTELKQKLSKELPEGEWISSYEAFMALALHCQAKAESRESMECKAMVNLRGRSALFPTTYLGNALGLHKFTASGKSEVSTMAQLLHNSLRTSMLPAHIRELEILSLIPEQLETHRPSAPFGRMFGSRHCVVERARYVVGWEDSVFGKSVVINSWVGYGWLNVQFGLKQQANFMRVPPPFRSPRQLALLPVTETKFTLRASLRPAEMKKFKQALLQEVALARDMRFVIREDRNALQYFPLWDQHFWTNLLADAYDKTHDVAMLCIKLVNKKF